MGKEERKEGEEEQEDDCPVRSIPDQLSPAVVRPGHSLAWFTLSPLSRIIPPHGGIWSGSERTGGLGGWGGIDRGATC